MSSARLTIAALLTSAGLTAIVHAQTTPSTPTTAPTRGPLFLSGGQPTRIEPVRIARPLFVDGEVHRMSEWLDPPSSGESLRTAAASSTASAIPTATGSWTTRPAG